MLYNSRLKPSDKPLKRNTPMSRGTAGLARGGRLNPVSNKMKAQHATQREAYAAAEDAGAEWCAVCGKPGPVEHSHLYPQGMHKKHRNDERNWLQVGKWCGCHTLFENNKALFAAKFKKAWAEIIRRMRAIDLKEYDKLAAFNPLLYPDD